MDQDNRIKYFLIKIWPSVYRAINTTLYFILGLLKSIVSYSIKQLRGI